MPLEGDGTKKQIYLMLDSGAFSAWKKQETIDVNDYADFINENAPWVDDIVNLDVIPGRFGAPGTLDDTIASARAGMENCNILKGKGITSIPVYHMGEPLEFLTQMVNEGYDYIGVSPDNSASGKEKIRFMDACFMLLTDPQGYPLVKTHGFAVTSIEAMYRYPWHSCDSMTWLMAASYGGILVPKLRASKSGYVPIYSVPPYTVKISDKSPTVKQGKHFNNLSVVEKSLIRKFVDDEKDINFEDLFTDFVARTKLNVRVLLRANEHRKVDRFELKNHRVRGFTFGAD